MPKATVPRSKFAHADPELFKPEPPEDPRLIRSLFCGRSRELSRGVATLKRCMDINGRWGRTHDKRPWIIHGESRVGKSHLARVIVVTLPSRKKRLKMIVSARERLQAIQVMMMLFEKIREAFDVHINDKAITDLQANPWVKATKDIIDRVSSFPFGTESVELILSGTSKSVLQGGAGDAGFFSSIVNFVVRLGLEREGASINLKMRRPTASDLSEYCGIMIDTLRSLSLIEHTLILVDDVDLLEGYADMDQNGRIERSILSDALNQLHQTPCVDVLLTSRSWYAQSRKEFQILIDLKEMADEDLVTIHDRRIANYCSKRYSVRFLSDGALCAAAEDVHGLPGVFLQHLDTAFRAYQDEDEWGERDYEWYIGVFHAMYERYRRKAPMAALALEEAVRDGRFEIDVRQINPFYQTIFENEFVFQSYYQESTYYLDALGQKVIQRLNTVAVNGPTAL